MKIKPIVVVITILFSTPLIFGLFLKMYQMYYQTTLEDK